MWNTNLIYSECLFSFNTWWSIIFKPAQTQTYCPALSASGSPAVKMYRPALSTSGSLSHTWVLSIITPPLEMVDSALCKWILCGFCWLMGLEESQERIPLIHWCLPQSCRATNLPVALIYLICRHQYFKWTWSENQHSSSTGDPHEVRLPGACAHERTT